MTVAAIRQGSGSPPVRVGRPIGRLLRKSHWPDFTARRIELGLTLRRIAKALTDDGHPTARSTVHWWEVKGGQPSESRIDPLAKILKTSRQAVLTMFSLDFGTQERAGEDEAERLPVADRRGGR